MSRSNELERALRRQRGQAKQPRVRAALAEALGISRERVRFETSEESDAVATDVLDLVETSKMSSEIPPYAHVDVRTDDLEVLAALVAALKRLPLPGEALLFSGDWDDTGAAHVPTPAVLDVLPTMLDAVGGQVMLADVRRTFMLNAECDEEPEAHVAGLIYTLQAWVRVVDVETAMTKE